MKAYYTNKGFARGEDYKKQRGDVGGDGLVMRLWVGANVLMYYY